MLTGSALLQFGTPEQPAEHLRPILTGERIWCQLFSEPDAAAHRGISFLLVDMASDGVEQMNGEAESDEVFLTDVRVPATNLLGPEHEGWMVGMSALTDERGYVGASGISLQRRLDSMLALGGELEPLERQELFDLWIRGTALWAMGRRQGPVASVLGSVAKLATTEPMFDLAMVGARRAGSAAMLDGSEAQGLVTAPGMRIAGGTSEIQRNIIGERILGLPKEPTPAPRT